MTSLEERIITKPLAARLTDRAQREWKKLSWQKRALPDFVIVGTQKGGTSSLHAYLSQHPRLFPADVKEVNFFDGGRLPRWDKYAEGQRLYRSYFPYASVVQAACGMAFEASPGYMHSPLAPRRMAQMIPEARLIVLLRDPVERAISGYFHEVRRGREGRPIMEALEAEDAQMAAVRASGNFRDLRWMWNAYVTRGFYADQLERILTHYSRKQVLVLESSEFYRDPGRVLMQVLDFIGIDNKGFNVDLTPIGVATNRTKVAPEVYAYLDERFAASNKRLFELLGRQFNWGKP